MNKKTLVTIFSIAIFTLVGIGLYLNKITKTMGTVTAYFPSPTTTITNSNLTQVYINNAYKFQFNYPSDWKIIKQDDNPTSKTLQIVSPNHFNIQTIYHLNKLDGTCVNKNAVGSDGILVMGNMCNIYFIGNKNNGTYSKAYILQDDEPCDNFPYIDLPLNKGQLSIQMFFDNQTEKSSTDFVSTDYQTAKAILSSLKIY